MLDIQFVRVAQIGVMDQVLLDRRSCQGVAAVIFRVIRMALDLVEGAFMALFVDRQQQQPPQILIFHR